MYKMFLFLPAVCKISEGAFDLLRSYSCGKNFRCPLDWRLEFPICKRQIFVSSANGTAVVQLVGSQFTVSLARRELWFVRICKESGRFEFPRIVAYLWRCWVEHVACRPSRTWTLRSICMRIHTEDMCLGLWQQIIPLGRRTERYLPFAAYDVRTTTMQIELHLSPPTLKPIVRSLSKLKVLLYFLHLSPRINNVVEILMTIIKIV
jgi:hypothetical protein